MIFKILERNRWNWRVGHDLLKGEIGSSFAKIIYICRTIWKLAVAAALFMTRWRKCVHLHDVGWSHCEGTAIRSGGRRCTASVSAILVAAFVYSSSSWLVNRSSLSVRWVYAKVLPSCKPKKNLISSRLCSSCGSHIIECSQEDQLNSLWVI